jgi:hypothetical protein
MRLFEVEDRFVGDLVTVLRNQLGRGDSERTSLVLTYPALSNIMKNMGYGEIDYDVFQKLYDGNPELKKLVVNYDEDKISLSTKVPPPGAENQKAGKATGPSVDAMAHSGAQKLTPDI